MQRYIHQGILQQWLLCGVRSGREAIRQVAPERNEHLLLVESE